MKNIFILQNDKDLEINFSAIIQSDGDRLFLFINSESYKNLRAKHSKSFVTVVITNDFSFEKLKRFIDEIKSLYSLNNINFVANSEWSSKVCDQLRSHYKFSTHY